jgi:tetratricopeptide (TPR) repeat protein
MEFLQEQRDLARKASRNEDWQRALSIWEMLRNSFLDPSEIFVGRGDALQALGRLDEAEAAFAEAKELFPRNEWAAARYAGVAEKRRDWTEAIRRWDDVANAFPNFSLGCIAKGDILQNLGELNEAEEIFRAAMHKFPDDEWAAIRHAGISVQKRDWAEALRRWEFLRARFPGELLGVLGQAEALRELGRIADAEAVLTEATEKFPPDEWLAVSLARTAAAGADWDEALRRWETAIRYFPNNPSSHVGKAETLSSLGRLDEAEAVLCVAAKRFVDDPLLTQAQATIALRRGNWEEAITHWSRGRDKFPRAPAFFVGLGQAFMGAGRMDDAEALSADAFARFPDDREVVTLRAQVATTARNWEEAAKRWEDVRKRFPEHPEVIQRAPQVAFLAKSEMAGQGLDPDQTSTSETTVLGDETAASKLMMNFENLGNNCELGFVQRFHGCEPLGLLRFSAMPYDLLMLALENRFSGVGDPANTILEPHPETREFFLSDKRYNMMAHTFTHENAIDPQKFFQQQCRRLTYLRRKLITDLENCEKILVFRTADFLSNEQIWALFRRIETYGPNTLLCARLETDAARDGRLEQLDDRLWVAYIKIVPPSAIEFDINQASWLKVCRQVYASWAQSDRARIGVEESLTRKKFGVRHAHS